ncbi:Adenosylmethionine-8-amino-7-oxononanoate aminotransferase [Thalassocella blandensis]|nr:Adenosylmethionine-8-amino-7-oxononanoate aminotransferase [Thalassocella blandensis]
MTDSTLSESDLIALDRQLVWHPYSSINSATPVFPISAAQGIHLERSNGQRMIDGMSSWWSAIHGYNHPEMNDAIERQLGKMAHVMFGGLTHEPAVQLCKTLVEISPKGLDHVFISDSGSVAMEVALKMALQYFHAQGLTEKNTFLTFKNGYHGDTFGAMSVCDPVTGMHSIFSGNLKQNIFVDAPSEGFDAPWQDENFAQFKSTFLANKETLAAVVLEPIVQGTGGMRFYSPQYLREIRALCDEHQVLMIADEIATGFGRTGKLFACEHAQISPDIMAVGKALTGGYLSLAATLCSQQVAQTICSGDPGIFMHGPTFMGNPLACAAANASLALLLQQPWQSQIKLIECELIEGLNACKNIGGVEDVRVLGAIGVVELKTAVDMSRIQPMFVERGVWIRPFGKLVYTMPPFICQREDIVEICSGIFDVLQAYLEN